MRYDIILYGTDTDVGSGYVLVSAVTATSEVTWSGPFLSANLTFELESEGLEYIGGLKDSSSGLRAKWSLKAKAMKFPQPIAAATSATTIENFYPTALLEKSYHYLYLGDKYPLQPADTAVSPAKCIAVAITGVNIEHIDGMKSITIELTKRATGV